MRHYTKRGAPLHEKFNAQWSLDPSTGCHEWTGRRNSSSGVGYGAIRFHGKDIRAHRVAWELHRGPIPHGMRVLHKCDNPGCVNVEHLFLGTQADNMADRGAKGRQACGERQGSAKLTESHVQEIRAVYANGRATQQQLAERFGVNASVICEVVNRKAWRHV